MVSVKKSLAYSIALSLFAGAAQADVWTKTIDAATYNGSTGTITFNDWGYIGPGGRNASQFDPLNGGFGQVGQIQHVVTRDADWKTADAPSTVSQEWANADGSQNIYTNANMDAGVNFYQWGYQTKGGSRFSNMKIDTDGDYFIAQNDMTFEFYNTFSYKQTPLADGTYAVNPGDPDYVADGVYPTQLAFQPYALSDAKGWCGSVLASNPGALEAMAGQVTFDFAFDVYFQLAPDVYVYSSTEIVRGFEMRSYGDITVDVTTSGGDTQSFSARAIINNTNPLDSAYADLSTTPSDASAIAGDPDYYNLVSFMGADVIPNTDYCGALSADWVAGSRGPGVYKYAGIIDGVTDAAGCTAAGGEWQSHAYPGFAFILRADGIRVVEAMDYSVYSDLSNVPIVIDGVAYNQDENGNLIAIADLSAVPVPAAVWLFGSGLIGLVGVARRRKA